MFLDGSKPPYYREVSNIHHRQLVDWFSEHSLDSPSNGYHCFEWCQNSKIETCLTKNNNARDHDVKSHTLHSPNLTNRVTPFCRYKILSQKPHVGRAACVTSNFRERDGNTHLVVGRRWFDTNDFGPIGNQKVLSTIEYLRSCIFTTSFHHFLRHEMHDLLQKTRTAMKNLASLLHQSSRRRTKHPTNPYTRSHTPTVQNTPATDFQPNGHSVLISPNKRLLSQLPQIIWNILTNIHSLHSSK